MFDLDSAISTTSHFPPFDSFSWVYAVWQIYLRSETRRQKATACLYSSSLKRPVIISFLSLIDNFHAESKIVPKTISIANYGKDMVNIALPAAAVILDFQKFDILTIYQL